MSAFLDRLLELFDKNQHGGFKKFTTRSGIRYTTVRGWFDRDVSTVRVGFIKKIADAYSLNEKWLAYGEGPKFRGVDEVLQKIGTPIGEFSPTVIPLLSFAQAGRWAAMDYTPEDAYAVGDAPEWVKVYVGDVPEGCIGLRVEGDSMLPDLRPGDVVLIQPARDLRPQTGQIVIVKDTDSGQVLVKRLHRKNENLIVLESRNPNYDPIIVTPEDKNIEIIGIALKLVQRDL